MGEGNEKGTHSVIRTAMIMIICPGAIIALASGKMEARVPGMTVACNQRSRSSDRT